MICFLPPARYDHEPAQHYTIRYGWWPRAYSNIGGNVINLPNKLMKRIFYSNQSYDCLIRHEKGHLNGWPPDHPGMITVRNYK
jgi:hypothetical protein